MTREHRLVNDHRNPKFKDIGGVIEENLEKRKAIVRKQQEAHIALHPELAYLFCEHGTYVGAHGCLADLFCEFC